MAQVSVTINGRSYPVACQSGEEPRIAELARSIDEKVRGLAQQLGAVGEARLLLLAALLLADELADAKEALGKKGALANGHASEDQLAAGIEDLASRIEAIAERLETHHI